ncbi:hypothetical protein V1477_017635 [Vespula maculifrons]|uniref:Uncharacterized protein n=1 Tax=Vespula maculifrons TaxID=7453 RepID=A0ABD2B6K7_VESMC
MSRGNGCFAISLHLRKWIKPSGFFKCEELKVSSHMHPTPLPSVPSREQHPWLHIQSFRIIKWELARARGLPSIVGTDAFAKRHVGRLLYLEEREYRKRCKGLLFSSKSISFRI